MISTFEFVAWRRWFSLSSMLIVVPGLAQIGEFSFILAELGRSLAMLTTEAYNLVLAGALISITLNPVLFRVVGPLAALLDRRDEDELAALDEPSLSVPRDHVLVCGYGRVGRMLAGELDQQGVPYLVVDQDRGPLKELQQARHPGPARRRAGASCC